MDVMSHTWDVMRGSSFHASLYACLLLAVVAVFGSASALSNAKQPLPAKAKGQNTSPLDTCIRENIQSGRVTILIVDTNNVRGKDDFKMWNCDLLDRLSSYRRQHGKLLQIVYAIDHGSRPQVFDYPDGVIVFAGPHRTADDAIAQATRHFAPSEFEGLGDDFDWTPRTVVVVTSDGELKQRCLRCTYTTSLNAGKNKRKKQPRGGGAIADVKVFGSPSLVSLLKDLPAGRIHDTLSQVESDVRFYTKLHAPFKSGQEQREVKQHGPWKSELFQPSNGGSAIGDDKLFPRALFQEETWHRVLVAECMRRLLETRQLLPSSPANAETEAADELVAAYKSFYEKNQLDNKSGLPVDTMFLDHRIRREPFLQQKLLLYLQTAVYSSYNVEAPPQLMQEQTLAVFKSPFEQAVEFMQGLVAESTTKTQDEIVGRYIKEAPSYLQFSSRKELLDLLERIAVREKRDHDHSLRWYLVENVATGWQDLTFQPRRGRRSEKRQRARLAENQAEVDDEIVAAGRDIEKIWFEGLNWSER